MTSEVPLNRVDRGPSFIQFVLQPAHRRYLYIALGGIVGQLILFKLLYPFADYLPDSYGFIATAATHEGFDIWPVGYAWFLYGFHQLTHSDTALVVFQYLFLETAILLFFFTLLYPYSLSPIITQVLLVALVFNPLSLYVSNYIAGDALFATLSILWFTSLLWMLHRPRLWLLVPHGVLLVVAFTVRYEAIYYPLVSLVVFLLSPYTRNVRIAGLGVPVVVILIFVQYTRDEAYRLTGVHQLSVLTDWHSGNNALYMYEHIRVDSTRIPYRAMPFHRMTQAYFDTLPDQWRGFTPRMGGIYLQHPHSPLKQYLTRYEHEHPDVPTIEHWGQVAPIFGIYATHLIKQHPLAYTRYYILPNTWNYFFPPLEHLATYNAGTPQVHPTAAQWFNYPSTQVRAASTGLSSMALFLVPIFFLIINLTFLAASIWFTIKRHWKHSPLIWPALTLAAALWILTAGFNILTSPVALRHLLFPMIIFSGFAALLTNLWLNKPTPNPPRIS